MEGYGKLEYANGDVYEGMWKNNQPCGRGQLTPVSGEIVKYEGLWDGGRISGKGVFTYENGGRYDGSVKGDKVWRAAHTLACSCSWGRRATKRIPGRREWRLREPELSTAEGHLGGRQCRRKVLTDHGQNQVLQHSAVQHDGEERGEFH